MKKLLIVAFLFGSAFSVCAQLVMSSGSQIVVASTSTLVVDDVVNTSGTISNDGTVTINGNITNNAGTIINAGTVNVSGDVTNNGGGLFDATSVGTVKFNGSVAQEISGDADVAFLGTIEIDNPAGVSLKTNTGHNQTINGTLAFTNGLFTLNEFDLTLGSTTTITGYASDKYAKTNSTGQLKRVVGSSDVIFPIGNASYNPLTLNNAGTSDTYGVIANDAKPTNFAGTTHIVDRSWDVTEATPGESNLTVTAQWIEGEEATAFDRTNSCVGVSTDGGTNVTWGSTGNAGSTPFTRSATGITNVGSFMVGDYFYGGLVIDLKVVLAAAWNTSNNNMDILLKTAGLIPTTDPYGLNTTVAAVPATAVDWVKVELRDATTPTVITKSFAKFVNQAGQIIEEDGTNMKVAGVTTGNYYVAIQHRNHLGVMTANAVNVTNALAVDFTSGLGVTWEKSGVANAQMKLVKDAATDVFGLWSGDANDDGQVQYASGANSDQVTVLNAVGSTTPGNIITNTYTKNDVNMDGDVQYASGANSDQVTILNVVGSTTPGNILSAHLPE